MGKTLRPSIVGRYTSFLMSGSEATGSKNKLAERPFYVLPLTFDGLVQLVFCTSSLKNA